MNVSNPSSGISVICGTDRAGSNSAQVARAYISILDKKGIDNALLDLADIPKDLQSLGVYGTPGLELRKLVERHIDPYTKLVFILPEYNGSYPGIAKLFVDLVHPSHFHGKKVGLVGLSDGHSGNQRGLDHFATVLNYLRADVLWQKPKLSNIGERLQGSGHDLDEGSTRQLMDHADRLVAF